MTTEAPSFPRPEVPPIPIPRSRAGADLWDWLTATDHKRIGLLYIGTSFVFFLIGGLIALVMRAELAQPGVQFVDAQTYSELFSPLSGEVLAVNTALADNPELVNTSPYGDGWMVRLRPSQPAEWDALLDAAAYASKVAAQ